MRISGPYGSYPPESIGATMNALCEREGLSTITVDSYTFGDKTIHSHGKVVAKYEWYGNEIFVQWLNGYRPNEWVVNIDNGIRSLKPRLCLLQPGVVGWTTSIDDLPFSDDYDRQDCFFTLQRWMNIRSCERIAVEVDMVNNKITLTVVNPSDMVKALNGFERFCDFKYWRRSDQQDAVNSFTPEVVAKAEEMLKTFASHVNSQPDQCYTSVLQHMEARLRYAWLCLAKTELLKGNDK